MSSSSPLPSSSSTTGRVRQLKESLAKELDKWNGNGEDERTNDEKLMDLLDRLEECPVDLHVLSETLVGTVVSKLKSNPNEEIASKAKALVKKWKKLAKEQGGLGGGGAAGGGSAASASSSVSSASSASAAASKSAKTPRSGPPPAKKSSSGISDISSSTASNTKGSGSNTAEGDAAAESEWADLPPLRKNICNKLHSVFHLSNSALLKSGFHQQALHQLTISRASEVEHSIQTRSNGDRSVYTEKARSLVFNLKKNDVLRQSVLMGSTASDELVQMPTEQLAPSEKIQQRKQLVNKLRDSRRLDWEQANEDKINEMCGIKGDLLKASLFTCGRCKSTKTTSTQKQTRSADEPMTVFVLCMNCGNRWKC